MWRRKTIIYLSIDLQSLEDVKVRDDINITLDNEKVKDIKIYYLAPMQANYILPNMIESMI